MDEFGIRGNFLENLDEKYLLFKIHMNDLMLSSGMLLNKSVNRFDYTKGIDYKPWFNQDCRLAKRKVKNQLKLCKRNFYNEDMVKEYCNSKKSFKEIIASSKKAYSENISHITKCKKPRRILDHGK